MIAYEDLDRALARWKARRSGSGAGEASAPAGDANSDANNSVRGMVVETVTVRESTGELDIVDAVLDET